MSLTPLDSFENRRLELLGKARMHCARLELLTLQRLKVVEAAFASDLTLKLFQAVEGHSCGISPVGGEGYASMVRTTQ